MVMVLQRVIPIATIPMRMFIQASFSIPQIAGDIEVKAEVAWNTDERDPLPAGIGPGFGVSFLSIDEEGIEAIKKYVSLGDYLQ